MAEKILITPRSVTQKGHPSFQRLKDACYVIEFCSPGKLPDETELMRLLPGCVGYLCGIETVTGRLLKAAPELRAISRNGTGVDNIDLDAAKAQRIRVLRADGTNARGVAELTMALILALIRSIPFSDHGIKQGGWERRIGIELSDRTLGLVGCGKIGRLVAKFALDFDMKVLAYDPYPDLEFKPSGRFSFASMDQIWTSVDILSLHCPPLGGDRPLIDRETVAKFKKGIFLVNTARASLLDEEAVFSGLESGQIAGVALDVFPEEPPRDMRLAKHPRVITMPHCGGYTRESVDRAISVAVDNLLQALGVGRDGPG
jgi:D-3-phosphoglycerate dehydrogenase / 2-oxoglutarate reductase